MKTMLIPTTICGALSTALLLLAASNGCRPSPFAIRDPIDSSRVSWGAFRRYPELTDPDTWLVGKYGMEAGSILYAYESEFSKTNVRHDFDEYGARELMTWYDNGVEKEPTFLTLLTTNQLTLIALETDGMRSDLSWDPYTFKIASELMPNFSRLTPAQIECFQIDSIGTRTFLDRTVIVYRIFDDRAERRRGEVWVWKGMILYKRFETYPRYDVDLRSLTSTHTAISVDTTAPPSDLFDLDD